MNELQSFEHLLNDWGGDDASTVLDLEYYMEWILFYLITIFEQSFYDWGGELFTYWPTIPEQ